MFLLVRSKSMAKLVGWGYPSKEEKKKETPKKEKPKGDK